MLALVLEKQHTLAIREINLPLSLGPNDVRIRIHTVGICGSDVHYFTHGKIGPFVVDQPMVLGHEAAGTVVEVGRNVKHLVEGDRVCMEPGIPDPTSKASRLGLYNIDPAVQFWATPPVHGCLTPQVIHPAAFAYKLPDHVSFAEGALVEPFAIGMQAAVKARIKPGDVAVVIGAGTIGLMTALAALAAGASQVLVSDLMEQKLAIAQGYEGIVAVNVRLESLVDKVAQLTDHWGADVVFEASGSARAYPDAMACVCPGGALVLVGMPVEPVAFDVVAAQAKEIRIETVFRYANVYQRAVNLIASGKVNLKPLISATFPFAKSIEAFERAASALPGDVKLQISFDSSAS
ncbi:NAD(P)-dependent alcohol dehydrogenase [Pseudomonas edaphica]|uniref:NAD(P)-dependent alcohol dehydrogenase n=1 Tax=Pseudomonas edaphica TaxID=2006980 RepID=A0ABY2U6F9_9PSED|nr:NAD(P)-dependent alcohol dehydrogenase [Pseudomonas edaphica]TLG91671.1 NAD(P)-dependent alcohol dehydrogenase [Pseudomonas edaphica]